MDLTDLKDSIQVLKRSENATTRFSNTAQSCRQKKTKQEKALIVLSALMLLTNSTPHPSSSLPGMRQTPHSLSPSSGGGVPHQAWII
ncbi:hypothetical protein AVEN_221324-1 [Araneus ventricosus]|uniref:Uncharacterized protein n=1 Tax=Araneus ventricosus TaxID=182803 RepID=A0A4Y2B210_ARAVE|nr:hypothetical protein AVEN_221324-1 [Araneus ventricosus]